VRPRSNPRKLSTRPRGDGALWAWRPRRADAVAWLHQRARPHSCRHDLTSSRGCRDDAISASGGAVTCFGAFDRARLIRLRWPLGTHIRSRLVSTVVAASKPGHLPEYPHIAASNAGRLPQYSPIAIATNSYCSKPARGTSVYTLPYMLSEQRVPLSERKAFHVYLHARQRDMPS